MKANLPPPRPPEPAPEPTPAPAPEPAPPTRAGGVRRKRIVAAVVLLAVAATAAGVWWWKRERPPEPPLPPGITDAAVADVVEKARARVLAEPQSGEAWGEYGTVLLANLFTEEADACFVQAAKLDPKDPRWPYARGQIALKLDPPAALALLTTAADAARDRPEYRLAFTLTLAESLLERGDIDRAAELFRQELGPPPGEDRAVFGLGLVALVRGDDTVATEHFKAVQNNPSCRKQAKGHLAALAFRRGDVSAAKQFEAEAGALELDPPWPDPYLDRVVTLQVGYRGLQRRVALLERDGRYEAAADAYLAQAREKRTSQALTGAGVNLARLRMYEPATSLLREAVQIDPADPAARYALALVLFIPAEHACENGPVTPEVAKTLREVVAEAKKATELKPDEARAYALWGLALMYLGEPKEAVEPLRRGLVIRPVEFDLHLGLGKALAAAGDRTGAEASLNTARELRPNDPRPAKELAKIKGGE